MGREHPAICVDHEVRGLLDGSVTQLWRPIRPQHGHIRWGPERGEWEYLDVIHNVYYTIHCPFGVPGDGLWVRETWAETNDYNGQVLLEGHKALYKAGATVEPARWRSPATMPRSASRFTYRVDVQCVVGVKEA